MVKTQGIVFRSFKYRETSLIVDIFTKDLGLRSYLINGVRSSKSKNAASILQAMTFLDLLVYDNKGADKLNRIKEFKLATYYNKIPFDVVRSMIGQCMIEILRKCIKDHDSNEEVYVFIEDWFGFLDTTEKPLSNILIMFLLELAALMGIAFAFEKEEEHDLFDLQEGQFTNVIPEHRYFISGLLCEKLYAMIQSSRDVCYEVEMSNSLRSNLVNELILFYRLHIESFGELKSLEILRSILR